MDSQPIPTDDFFAGLSAAFDASFGQQCDSVPAVTVQIEGPLLPEDVAEYLDEHGQLKTTAKVVQLDLKKLKAKHHSVARLVAEGVPDGVVAEITGYTPSYIGVLRAAPAMQELISHYRAPGNAAALHIGENLRRVGSLALERLESKIEDDQLSPTELTQAAKLGLDRAGHGPQSQVHNVTEHHIIDHAELAQRHLEAKRRDAAYIVSPEDVRAALPAPSDPDSED